MDCRSRLPRALLAALLIVCAAALPGCTSRPKAPAIRDEPVYQNDQEGFRFLAPEGWTQRAKSAVPPGKVEKERLLVTYHRMGAEKPASLEVTLADLPESADLAAFLIGPAYGSDKWRPKGAAQPTDVNDVAALRHTFTARVGKDDLTREVVTFRRGERVYFFTGVFPTADSKAREDVRRAVGSVIWKN